MEETAWLIETKDNTDGLYMWFVGRGKGDMGSARNWTRDPLKPIRFARKEDAEAVLEILWPTVFTHPSSDFPFVTEHIWLDRGGDAQSTR